MDPERRLHQAWQANAAAWTAAVRGGRIASRVGGDRPRDRRGGARAAAGARARRRLRRGLARAPPLPRGEVVGIDGSAALIAAARAAHPDGSYRVLSYADAIVSRRGWADAYDVVVCNFALLGEHLAPLLAALGSALAAEGMLLIQTLHPWAACGDLPYRDGWREETFAGFGEGRFEPMPWYFRTLASWLAEIAAAGLVVARCQEPLDPASGRPLSLLLSCRARG